jgi:hypothetical protein
VSDELDELGRELAAEVELSHAMGAWPSDSGLVPVLAAAGWELAEGYWHVNLEGGFEVTLEPMVFGGHELAIYQRGDLVVKAKLMVDVRRRSS